MGTQEGGSEGGREDGLCNEDSVLPDDQKAGLAEQRTPWMGPGKRTPQCVKRWQRWVWTESYVAVRPRSRIMKVS